MTAHRKPNGTRAVRGSKSGRPIMALLDLLGRRWMLRIIWELRNGPLTSRALRQACDAPRRPRCRSGSATLESRGAGRKRADRGLLPDHRRTRIPRRVHAAVRFRRAVEGHEAPEGGAPRGASGRVKAV